MQPSAGPTGDASVRATDQDALVSRVSAATLGYLDDPTASLFLPPALRRSKERRPPLINIGTHARTWAVDALVESFLSEANGVGKGKARQVFSIGAGNDSRFWRMKASATANGKGWNCAKWVEVDFAEATATKARTISTKAELKGALGGDVKIEHGGTGITSPLYALVPGDLRSFTALASSLTTPNGDKPPLLDPSLPTLLLAECVMVYLPPETNNEILSWISGTFSDAAVISYDPFGLDDNFGKVMIRNLATRNLSLPSALATPTLDSLSQRCLANGFLIASTFSVKQIRDIVIPSAELERVAKIEQIDEVEELNLVLEHYAITWGSKGDADLDLKSR
ncbi:leucine carboxyl methyltransferase [Pseudohyphozyma bogoriensis]|nr:leucine carboxyl methyltransferase [Pseudohyphozyma bogoriensis]